jgi:DNA-binding protein
MITGMTQKLTQGQQKSEPVVEPQQVVYIGRKPLVSYVYAAAIALREGGGLVILKARGLNISKAVTVAEVLRRRFIPEMVVERIEIGTQEVETRNGKRPRSTMEITISLPKKK